MNKYTIAAAVLLSICASAVSAAPPEGASEAVAVPAGSPLDALIEQAAAARKAGQLEAAAGALEKALQLSPTHVHVLAEAAQVAAQRGAAHQAEAIRLSRRAIFYAPTNHRTLADSWHTLARALEAEGDHLLALEAYQSALRHRPAQPQIMAERDALQKKMAMADAAYQSLDDLCMQLQHDLSCQVAVSAEGSVSHSCHCEAQVLDPPSATQPRVALVQVKETHGPINTTVLAVEHKTGWQKRGTLADQRCEAPCAFKQLVFTQFDWQTSGGSPQLWLRYERDQRLPKQDGPQAALITEWHHTMVLCEAAQTQLSCVQIPLGWTENGSVNTPKEGEQHIDRRAQRQADGKILFEISQKRGNLALDFSPEGPLSFEQLRKQAGVLPLK